MGNSLRDELLKVGLISEERAARPRPKGRGKQRPGRKRAPPQARSESARSESARSESARSESARSESARSESARSESAQSESAQSESAQSAPAVRHVLRENRRRSARFVRDQGLAGGSVAENAKKALRRKIDALIEGERRNDEQAEIPYHFVKGKRIKRIYVTEAQRGALTDGSLVIAALEGNHHLMTPGAAEQLIALAPQTVLCIGAGAEGGPDGESDEHPVPDDITW